MSAVDSIEDTLGDKVGPFPVWVWGAGLGGVAVAFMWFNRSQDTTAASADGQTLGADGTDTGLQGDLTSADAVQSANDAALYTGNDAGDNSDPAPVVNNYYGTATAANPTGAPAPPPAMTQTLWFSKGVAYLVSRGHSPIASQNALSSYLGHRALSPAFQAAVNDVIAHQGLPPGVSTTGVVPVAAAKPSGGASAQVKSKVYVVRKGDNRTSITRHFWGSASHAHLETFRKMNGFGTNYKLHVGQHVKVKA